MGKQFLVVKVKGDHGSHLNLVPIAGVMPIEAAEAVMREVCAAEPEETFMIQEVGNA
jgi:hypothetical protein